MPMQTVTKPIMLDETGLLIVDALSGLTDAVKPDAVNIPYDNTDSGLEAETVQGAIDENAGAISELNSSLNNLSKLIVGVIDNDGSITLSPKSGSHLLIISRANQSVYCGLVFDYWGTDIKTAFGTLPSNLMVGKNASTNNVSITNHLGFAVAYTLV